MVFQEFMLVPSLTVAENMVLREEPLRGGLFIDYAKAVKATREISEKYRLPIDPNARVADLPVGMKQRVEILKALYRGAKILILDEPTAVLTPQETEELFRQLLILRDSGHTVIFISHKIREIKQICDRITILKDGHSMGIYQVADISEADISRLMVGHDVKMDLDKQPTQPGEVVLQVKNLCYGYGEGKLKVDGVSFSVRRGEVVGIAGVEGNGQRELIEMITGIRPIQRGSVHIGGKDISKMSVYQIREEARCAYVPQERLIFGVAPDTDIEENLMACLFDMPEYSKGGILRRKPITARAKELIQEFTIKCDNEKQAVGMLSGGNIQKVVAARELSRPRDLIVVDQPSRGIDVGATKFIQNKIIQLRDAGSAVLVSSADLAEIMALSDRLLVMYEGEIAAVFTDLSGVTEQQLGEYMLGIKKQTPEEIGACFYEQ